MKFRIILSLLLLIVLAVAVLAKDDESQADVVPATEVQTQPNYNF